MGTIGTIVNWGYYIVFIIAGLAYLVCFWNPWKKNKKIIASLNEELAAYTPQSILINFESFSEKLEKNPLVAPLWKKYEKTLIKVRRDDMVAVYSTVDSDEYINPVNLMSGLNVSFFSNLGGIFTGLGILGTFVGLTLGIWGIDTSSSARLQAGISTLLAGSSMAFVTSIIGIICAIGFNSWYSRDVKEYSKMICCTADHFDRIFIRKKLEDFFIEENEVSQKQLIAIQDLSTNLAVSLGETFNNTLEKLNMQMDQSMKSNLKETLEPLFTELIQETKKLNGGAMNTVAESFTKGAGAQIAEFADTLKELSSGMKEILEHARQTNQQANEELQSSLNSMIEKLNQSFDQNLIRQKEGIDQSSSQMQELMKSLTEALRETAANVKSSSDAQKQNMEQSGEKMRSSMEESMVLVKKALEQISQKMEERTTAAAGKLDAASQGITKIAEIYDKTTKDAVKNMVQSVQNLMTGVEKGMQQMQNAMDQKEQGLVQVLNSMQRTLQSSHILVKDAGTAANAFQKAAVPIHDIASQMGKMVTSSTLINSDMNRQVEQISSISQNTQKNAEHIEKATVTTQQTWKNYEDEFIKVKENLDDTLESLCSNIEKYNAVTTDALSRKLLKFDQSISAAVDRLASLYEETNDTLEDLNDHINKLKK